MKIKLAILERDQSYLNRIVGVFGTKYADKFQLYSFTDMEMAMSTLETAKIEVLIASEVFEIDFRRLPKRCGFAYFVDSTDVDTVNGQRAICKFQKADLIYKNILSIYSENAGNISGLKFGDDSTKIIFFQPVSGGAGASSMAASCAIYLSSKGKKTLYLNLEKFGSSDIFFEGEGQFDMSDLIFTLKSKKANLAMKLESSVKQDGSGVFFYSQAKVALDMLELSADDMIRLISELQLMGSYDYIVVDFDFTLSKDALKVLHRAHTVVWVGDGSELSNIKLFRSYHALGILEQNAESSILNRLAIIYNKFSNKTGKAIQDIDVRSIGGAPRYEHATSKQVLEQLSRNSMFDAMM